MCASPAAQDAQADIAVRRGTPPPTLPALGTGTGYRLEVIFVNAPGHPTNLVPGLDVPFASGGGSAAAFGRPWFSSDGAHWVIRARADTGSADDDAVYLLDRALFLQEGTQASWAVAGELVGNLDERVGVNAAGDVLITNNTGGIASATADDYVVLITGGGPLVLAQEGGLVDGVLPALAGATWDDRMTAPSLTDTGAAAWEADGIDGTTGGAADDELLVLGNDVALQEGEIPDGLAGTPAGWENFDADDFYLGPAGAPLLVQGDTDGVATEDDIVALDGAVVLQEGQVVPGSAFLEPIDTGGIVKAWLDASGSWYARGNNAGTEQDWVVREGIVVAQTQVDDEVVAGSGEHWSDSEYAAGFFAFDGNASGAYILGGVTDGDAGANGVLVLDDGAGQRRVLCREGDPVDLDGNGAFDDDRFFHTFGTDDVLLLENEDVWFSATLRDENGVPRDQGLFRLLPCGWSAYGEGATPVNALTLGGAGETSVGTTFQAVTSDASGAVVVTILAFGSGSFPLFGGAGLLDPLSVFEVYATVPAAGIGTQDIPIPNDPILVGLELYMQSGGDDAGQPFGNALSNGLKLTVCE